MKMLFILVKSSTNIDFQHAFVFQQSNIVTSSLLVPVRIAENPFIVVNKFLTT